MRVVDLDQRTDEWKQWRKLGVTATDSPVLFGLVPEQNSIELWAEKTGLKAVSYTHLTLPTIYSV